MNPQNKKHYYYLDFLRLVAALLVLVVHARYFCFTNYTDLNPQSQGPLSILFWAITTCLGGCSILTFFALSGFLVGGRYLERLTTVDAKEFLKSRLIRIMPPLAMCLLLSVLVDFLTGNHIEWFRILGNLLCLQGVVVRTEVGVLWTIPYEIWFYVLLSGIFYIFGSRRNQKLGWLLLLVTGIVFSQLHSCYLFTLLFGILGFFLQDRIKFSRTSLFILLAILLVSVGIEQKATSVEKTLEDSRLYLFNVYFFHMLQGFIISIMISRLSNSRPRHKFTQQIEKIGNKYSFISFSLFLTHYQILRLFRHFFGLKPDLNIWTLLYFLGSCLTCIIVSLLFYYLVEKKLVKIIRNIFS